MRNSPRFPQGRVVKKVRLPVARAMSQDSIEKLDWAKTQIFRALRSKANEEVAIPVTNFDAHPVTMKHWLNKAIQMLFPSGNRHLTFRYEKVNNRNGTLYVEVLFGKKPMRKASKGEEITQRV